MKRWSILLGSAALVALSMSTQAQEKDTKGVNPLSVRDINDADVMMKRTLWRGWICGKSKISQCLRWEMRSLNTSWMP